MEAETFRYRDRIYSKYVTARITALVPSRLEELAPRAPLLRRIIQREFPSQRDAAILDLGCGHGALLYFAQQAGYTNVRGVDGSPEQVQSARELGIRGVEEGDIRRVVAERETVSLDVVVTFDVIEHFGKAEILEFADHVYRILKPGGKWILHVPNSEGPFGARMRYWDFTHEVAFTRLSLSQILLSTGFERVRMTEDQPVPHGIKSAVRFLLWKLLRTTLRFYLLVETGEGDGIFSLNLLAVAEKQPESSGTPET